MPRRTPNGISKRSKAVAVPTVAELQNVLSRYNIDSKIDEIEEDDVLRLVFNALRKKFHPITTQSNRDAVRILKLDVMALRIPDAIVAALPGWLDNLWDFWGSWSFHRQPLDNYDSGNGHVKQFVESSWAIRDKLSEFRVLWRFSSVALCLTFKQWKPEWLLSSYLLPECVGKFLSTFGCIVTESNVKKTMHIIRSGQRRLSFCEELSRAEPPQQNPHSDQVIHSKLETLGILFLDDIPDSSFDSERAMSQDDVSNTTKFLRSNHITEWLGSSGSGQNAIRLLDFPIHNTFLELSNRSLTATLANGIEGLRTASQLTQREPDMMADSIAIQHGHLATSTDYPPCTRYEHRPVPDATTDDFLLHAAGNLLALTNATICDGHMQRCAALPSINTLECPPAPLSFEIGGSQYDKRALQGASFPDLLAQPDFEINFEWEPEATGQYVGEVRHDKYSWRAGDGLGLGIGP